MRSAIVAVTILGVSAAGCGGRAARPVKPIEAPQLTAKQIVERSGASIVRIESVGPKGQQVGSGFLLDSQGLVATNLHVILGTQDIKIKLANGQLYPVTQIVNLDPMRDLVLLRFVPSQPTVGLPLGDSSKVSAGDQIVAIGNPLGVFENTVSEGLVSSVRTLCSQADVNSKSKNCPGELTLLQISAPISQGSSGGPLFNQHGEVIGITTAINTEGQLINFAMPTNYLKPLIAAPSPMTVQVFAEQTKSLAGASEGAAPDDGPVITRNVPMHAVSVLDGCDAAQLAEVADAIRDAIQLGAPLYNQGNHEACYRIYENTVTKYERDGCAKGLRAAFGDGLVRASALVTYKEKAWALRDTFDGFLLVTEKWSVIHGAIPTKQ